MSNKHFNVLVIGDNHAEEIKQFDNAIKVEPYVVYEFAKAEEYQKQRIRILQAILDDSSIDERYKENVIDELSYIKSLSPTDFYLEETEAFTLDESTGNAISTKNPDGKYDYATIAKNFAYPFILKDGSESFSARKKDIDWDIMHLNAERQGQYISAWETVVEHREPEGELEETIYENMKERMGYFSHFPSKEAYVKHNTAFWAYAVVKNNEWTEVSGSELDWVSKFYNEFVSPLPDNTLLTLYECSRT